MTQGENGLKTPKIKPQPILESDYADATAQIQRLFFDVIFRPIIGLLAPHSEMVKAAAKEMRKELRNAPEDPIVAAIKAGRIQYKSGVFSGTFNATVSKALIALGAKFNKNTKLFTLTPELVPMAVKDMAIQYHNADRKLHEEALRVLKSIEDSLDHLVTSSSIDPTVTIGRIERGFKKSVGDALGRTDMTPESREELRKNFTDSLVPPIRGFAQDTIMELRKEIEANAETGYRFDTLVTRIQSRYDVSKSKAEFLARNETGRCVSMHRQARFEEAGVSQYIWRTSGDTRVREDHKKLNGRTFMYSHPPIVDEATGRRDNPGMDYGCRCADEPVLPAHLTPQKEMADALS